MMAAIMSGGGRNVVLVRLASPEGGILAPPLGIGYLLKALTGVPGINRIFIDCRLDRLSDASLLSRLEELDPLLTGFQVFSFDYDCLVGLLPSLIRRVPKSAIVAGGPHPSGLPDFTLKSNPALDFVVAGEGEAALPMLVRWLLSDGRALKRLREGDDPAGLEEIPNLVYRKGPSCVRNPVRETDINALAAPDWTLLRPERYPPSQHGTFHRSRHVVPILTSRGCPYPCMFCAGRAVTGKAVRLRDPGNVADEIEWLMRSYGFEEFTVEDENFTFHRSHVLGLADEIKRRRIKAFFSFPNGVRLDRLDEEVVARMAGMGTYAVCLGIESGSRSVLERMRKDWDPEMVRGRVELLRRHGIITTGSYILGYRDETMADIKETIRYALSLPTDMAHFSSYLPLPGSGDFDSLVGNGSLDLARIEWRHYRSFARVLSYHPPSVPEAELRRAVRSATIRFYLRPRILLGLARRLRSFASVRSFAAKAFRTLFRP